MLGGLDQVLEELPRPIGGPIVHNNDLFFEGDGLNSIQKLLDGGPLVIHRDHDRELGAAPPLVPNVPYALTVFQYR
jgi:hypothetical protein